MKRDLLMQVRGQDSKDGDQISLLTGVTFDPEEDRCRPEFAKDADPNTVLARFHATGQPPRLDYGGVSATTDFSLDLQEAIQAVEDSQAAWKRLPADVRSKYGSWEALATAIESGQYKPTEAAGVGSPAASGGSASDSAPVPPPAVG